MSKNSKQQGTLCAILKKELFLATPLPFYLFALLGLMTAIPSYPIIVGIGYVTLAIFNSDQFRRSNRDVEFTCTLPVKRADVVTGKSVFVVVIELLTLLFGVVGALLSVFLSAPSGNMVGLDPNLTFFGVAFTCLGVFNLLYIPGYFKTGYKSGIPILKGVVALLIVYAIVETVVNVVPGFNVIFDSLWGEYMWARAIVLCLGAVAYFILTNVAIKRAQKFFEKVSL